MGGPLPEHQYVDIGNGHCLEGPPNQRLIGFLVYSRYLSRDARLMSRFTTAGVHHVHIRTYAGTPFHVDRNRDQLS